METKDLESKVWFRFLKVAFVFAYMVVVLGVLAIAYASKPYSTVDSDNSVIVCDNGKTYKAGDNGIDGFAAWVERSGGTQLSDVGFVPNTNAKDQATMLCLGNPSTFPVGQAPWELKTPPYTVKLVNKTVGNWWSFAGYTALSLLIVVVIFELIKRSFLYIAIGKKFFSRRQRKT